MTKTILITGGRHYSGKDALFDALDGVCAERGWMHPPTDDDNTLPDVRIICGGASGADALAQDWAVLNWCLYKEFLPNWGKYGRAAGPIRNQQMLDEGKPDLVVACPGGSGTRDMCERARQAGVEILEITPD